jgi:hypothetical protein
MGTSVGTERNVKPNGCLDVRGSSAHDETGEGILGLSLVLWDCLAYDSSVIPAIA